MGQSVEVLFLEAMTYPGGKNADGVYQSIINYLPPHEVYIEPFLGSGAIIRYKKPAKNHNIGIEVDQKVISKFHRKASYQVIHGNAFDILEDTYQAVFNWSNNRRTLIYCDPPYIKSSRRSQKDIYTNEWSDKQHLLFLRWCIALDCNIVISAYQNPLYDEGLYGWRREYFEAGLRTGERVTESLYMNFPIPDELHEYTYLGKDCWDRQRIKRKIKGKITQLQKLPLYERKAIIEALTEVK